MDLAALVLTAMTTWVPVREHLQFEPREVTVARYESIANDIAQVVEENDAQRIGTPEREALLLASVASYESHFAARVDQCKKRGPSWTIFQISSNRRLACSDRKAAARIALYRIRESFAVCAGLPYENRLSFYATGKVERTWFSRSRVERATRFEAAHVPPPSAPASEATLSQSS